MSFILDALKKSETDRQRQTGPALFEVKVAPPKARFPVWAVAIVALLAINMVIVGWLLLRHSSREEATNPQSAPVAVTTQPAPTPSVATMAPAAANPQTSTVPQQAFAPAPPPQTQPTSAPQSASTSRMPLDDAGKPPVHLPNRDEKEPTLAGNTPDPGDDQGGTRPDDYAPATDPGAPIFKGHVKRGVESGLMLYQDLATTNGSDLPPLRLDLHVYAANPQERFALINMRKVREGEMLQSGVKVEAITPDGVVMSHNGTKFLLPRD